MEDDKFCSVCGIGLADEAVADPSPPTTEAPPTPLAAALAPRQRQLDKRSAEFKERRANRTAEPKPDGGEVARELAQAAKDGAHAAGMSAGNLSVTASAANLVAPIALVAADSATPAISNLVDAIRSRPRTAKPRNVTGNFPCGDCGQTHRLVYFEEHLYDPDSGHRVRSVKCPRCKVVHHIPAIMHFRTLRCGEVVFARIPDVWKIIGGEVLDFDVDAPSE